MVAGFAICLPSGAKWYVQGAFSKEANPRMHSGSGAEVHLGQYSARCQDLGRGQPVLHNPFVESMGLCTSPFANFSMSGMEAVILGFCGGAVAATMAKSVVGYVTTTCCLRDMANDKEASANNPMYGWGSS